MDQIDQILSRFDRSQLKVVISEEMHESRDYSAIYDFLGVSNAPKLDVQDKFTNHYEPMRNATMKRLKKHFKEDNERLFDFLGRRVEAWE